MARAFRGLKRDPDRTYDAVVIGAGVGGLICANLLVRDGLRVLLVEQHYMAGGYCSTFRRAGYTFDAATHFYPLLGNAATLTGRLLRGIGSRTQWIKMEPVDHFHFPDGSEFFVPSDFERYLNLVRAEFSSEREAIERFFGMVREAYFGGLLYYFRDCENTRAAAYRDLSVRDVLERCFVSPRLKLLLTADCGHWGAPPSRTSFVFDSMLRLAYFLGNYYPKGGSQVFVDDLAARFEENGGHILMSSDVKRIFTGAASASGVELETGIGNARHRVTVHAGCIVSNADLGHTLDLLGPAAVSTGYVADVNRLRPSAACFLMHIGLKGISETELRRCDGYHWSSWDAEHVGSDAFKLFVPTLYDPEMAPPGAHIIIVQKLTRIDYNRIGDWSAHKAFVEAYILENLARIIPNFSDYVVVRTSASAHTSWRFTRNSGGSMLGWEVAPDQLGQLRPGLDGPVRNLYLTGHWAVPGGGITPVIISAQKVAQRILTGVGAAPDAFLLAREAGAGLLAERAAHV
jgi:phytoene dehydrogenase-like protein